MKAFLKCSAIVSLFVAAASCKTAGPNSSVSDTLAIPSNSTPTGNPALFFNLDKLVMQVSEAADDSQDAISVDVRNAMFDMGQDIRLMVNALARNPHLRVEEALPQLQGTYETAVTKYVEGNTAREKYVEYFKKQHEKVKASTRAADVLTGYLAAVYGLDLAIERFMASRRGDQAQRTKSLSLEMITQCMGDVFASNVIRSDGENHYLRITAALRAKLSSDLRIYSLNAENSLNTLKESAASAIQQESVSEVVKGMYSDAMGKCLAHNTSAANAPDVRRSAIAISVAFDLIKIANHQDH